MAKKQIKTKPSAKPKTADEGSGKPDTPPIKPPGQG